MTNSDKLSGWFAGRVPEHWFTAPATVTVDRDEIQIVGELAEPTIEEGASEETVGAARAGRVKQFREDTRARRIGIAREAEHAFGRKVSWGARCGDHTEMFTTFNAPVMTRLQMSDREVLDALVDSGVARSRSHALAWCVRLVGKHQAEWINELKEAMSHVEKVRDSGPDV